MLKEYTCIICPNGCAIEAEIEDKKVIHIEGALCKKGKDYIEQEQINPQRNIATTILVVGGNICLASVRLNKPIPKSKIFDVMKEIRKVKVTAPVEIGQVVIENVLGLDSDVIVTKKVEKVV